MGLEIGRLVDRTFVNASYKHCTVHGNRVLYSEQGTGIPFLLIHGYPGRPQDFRWITPGLPELRCISLAMPGLDITEPLSSSCLSINERASFVCAFIKVLGLSEAFLLGHSMGGVVATQVANLSPHIQKLVLLSSVGPTPYRAFRRSKPRMFHSLLNTPMIGKAVEPLVRFGFSALGFPRGVSMEAMRYVLACAHALSFEEHKNNLERLSVPVLSMWSHDDPLIESSCFHALENTIQNVHSVAFEKGGHNLQKTQSDKILRNLRSFLLGQKK